MKLEGQDIPTIDLFRNVWHYVSPLKFTWFGLMFLSLILIFLGLIDPLILQFLIDRVLIQGQHELLMAVIAVFIIAKAAALVLSYIYSIGYVKFTQRFYYNVRNDLFEHLQHKKIGYFRKKEVGDLLRTLMNDVRGLNSLFSVFEIVFTNIIRLSVTLVIIFAFDWRLSIIGLIAIPIFAMVQASYLKRIKAQATDAVRADVKLMNFFEERLSNILLIKLFSRELQESMREKRLGEKRIRENVRFSKSIFIVSAHIGVVTAAAIILALWFGASAVMAGTLTVGGLMAIYTYIGQMFGPVSTLISIPNSLQESLISGHRVFSVMGAPEEVEKDGKMRSLKKLQGKIVFNDVTFAYPEKPYKTVIKNLNIDISPGETIGIVGGSGAGKTTLIRLILRFYEPQKGKIYLDNIRLENIKRSALRSLIGVSPQDNLFFPATIFENIAYSHPSISEDVVEKAAKAAGIHKNIMECDNGYSTLLGPDGRPLSAGERQRLSIARVIVKNPDIFIFDEPTADVDPTTEQTIKKAIKKFSKNRTTIIIAHRLSTLEFTDRVIVLKNGRIAEEGTLEELKKPGTEFAKLFNLSK